MRILTKIATVALFGGVLGATFAVGMGWQDYNTNQDKSVTYFSNGWEITTFHADEILFSVSGNEGNETLKIEFRGLASRR